VDKGIAELKNHGVSLVGWSIPKVLAEVDRLHRQKGDLSYAAMRRNHPALLSAAERLLKSWGRTLAVKGIAPNVYLVHYT